MSSLAKIELLKLWPLWWSTGQPWALQLAVWCAWAYNVVLRAKVGSGRSQPRCRLSDDGKVERCFFEELRI